MATRAKTSATQPAAGQASLSGSDLVKVLELIKGSTSVEVKVVVPDQSHRAAVKSLGFDPIDAEPRQVYFFDTPDLALNRAGMVIRARRIQGGKGDTVVKLRPVNDPGMIDPELRKSASFKIEVDVMPGGYVCSASFKGTSTAAEVRDAAEGRKPIAAIFSKEQRAFFKKYAPKDLDVDQIIPMGPIFILRLKADPAKFNHRITVELWLYPDGSRIFEVSAKGEPANAFQVGAEFRAFMEECGIPIEVSATTKTSNAMKFFAKQAAG